MNSHKKIEINQSSLLGLKAELLRKKNEVSNAKYSQQITTPKVIKKKLTTKLDSINEGVAERDKRDAEEIQQESDELKKSQNILIQKAKLYDQLTTKALGDNSTIDTSNFLVDFRQKANEDVVEESTQNETVESEYEDFSEDESEWVDFKDCLGRTKRCHKDDLEVMKEQDERLKKSLFGGEKKEEEEKEKSESEVQLPQLCSEDMKKEILRQKWEEQERNLLDKKDVHYQDILFDEARTHGVGYYGFSTDETERARQQEELNKLRKETKQHQTEAQTAAQRKQKQMEERLKAARRRKRERLGLPPEEEEEVQVPEPTPEPEKPEPEELRRDVRKPAPLRPWDIGKDGTSKIMSQEEWVEKKRSERIDEFAPPQNFSKPKRKKPKRNYYEEEDVRNDYTPMEPVPIDDELEEKYSRGRGAEIPPPAFDVYGPSTKSRCFSSQSEIEKSIEEGLNFLRKKVEQKQSKSGRDEIDIM